MFFLLNIYVRDIALVNTRNDFRDLVILLGKLILQVVNVS